MAELYKAQVRARWRNRLSGQWMSVAAGTAVEFDAGDFNDPDTGVVTLALTSLEDVLRRGLFVAWSAEDAGDVEKMSRDEMLELMATFSVTGPGEDGAWPHNISEEDLRPLVQAAIEARLNPPPPDAPPARSTRRTRGA